MSRMSRLLTGTKFLKRDNTKMMEIQPKARVSYGKLSVLLALYFIQGLPFGFQASALPTYLRSEGLSLEGIGFLGLLSAPWMLKALWAPLVDRYHLPALGRRRSWIVVMQVGLVLTCVAAAFVPPADNLPLLLGLILLMNFFAATQDIAVDGLAVEMLSSHELGPGNAAQVVGYKFGMLTGGGLLVAMSASIGWQGLFLSMAGLVGVVLVYTFLGMDERRLVSHAASNTHPTVPHESLRAVLAALKTALAIPGSGWLLLFIGTYKVGEAMIDAMFKPFLVDVGFTPAQLGLYVGTYGMMASLVGSMFGGWLSTRLSILNALTVAATLRLIPLLYQWYLSLGIPSSHAVIASTVGEHLFGGMLTSSMFAFMMSRVDKRIGATHYTALATVEVLGKSPGIWASGILARHFGYSWLFMFGILLTILFLGVLVKIQSPAPENGNR